MGRTITVNKNAAAEATSGPKALTPGRYIASIIGAKTEKFKSGNNVGKDRLVAQFKIGDESSTGEGAGRRISDFAIPLDPDTTVAFKLYQFFGALGVNFDADTVELPDNDDLLGEEIGLVIDVEEDNRGLKDDAGNPVLRNTIKRYFKASEGVGQKTVAADDFDLTSTAKKK